MTCTLDLYTDYLLSSTGPTTATGLSRLLDGVLSHDHVTRWLSQTTYGPADIWRQVKPLIRQAEARRPTEEFTVLIVDDSALEKTHTDANELLCTHWDHSQQRYIKGLNFISLLYQAGELALPIAVELVRKTVPVYQPKTQKTSYQKPIHQERVPAADAARGAAAGGLPLPAGRYLVCLGREHGPSAGPGPSRCFCPRKQPHRGLERCRPRAGPVPVRAVAGVYR